MQPNRPNDPDLQAPTQRATQRIPIAPLQPPVAERPGPPEPPAAPAPPPVPPIAPPAQPPAPHVEPPSPPAPPVAEDEEPQPRGLIERMTTRKLPVAHPSFRTEEPTSTYRLPLRPGARTLGVAAYRLGLTVDGHEMLTDVSFTARPGTLTAVVGPSAARNSALLELAQGQLPPVRPPSTAMTSFRSRNPCVAASGS